MPGQQIKFRDKIPWNLINIANFEIKQRDFCLPKPVYDAIKKTKKALIKDKCLIGFVGAPWTLITYLLNLKEQNKLNKKIDIKNDKRLDLILKKLDEFLKIHIIHQKEAGVDVIQIFDSWASLIAEEDLKKFCFNPNKSLVDFCKKMKYLPSVFRED